MSARRPPPEQWIPSLLALVVSLLASCNRGSSNAASREDAQAKNALLLGEAEACHLGIDVERTKRTMIVLVALIVGAAVAVSGVLGFVGLVVPHLLRLGTGADNRQLLPGSALLGASLLRGAAAVRAARKAQATVLAKAFGIEMVFVASAEEAMEIARVRLAERRTA